MLMRWTGDLTSSVFDFRVHPVPKVKNGGRGADGCSHMTSLVSIAHLDGRSCFHATLQMASGEIIDSPIAVSSERFELTMRRESGCRKNS